MYFKGAFELAAGKHEIPFSFALPSEIPSSFEGKYGYVRYEIKASLKGAGFMHRDYKHEVIFQVNTVVDLKYNYRNAVGLHSFIIVHI